MCKMKSRKTALYLRASRYDKVAVNSQKNSLLRYAKELGLTDLQIYQDNGFGGLNADRPALRRLTSDIASGEIGAVLTADISRVYSDAFKMRGFVKNIKDNGVEIYTVDNSHEVLDWGEM